jgi:LPXTG-motif cell wall-anchored protein
LLPVEARIAALPEPEPEPQAVAQPAAPEPSPEPVPVATSGQADLPKTASSAPIIAMLGLFAFAGSLGLRSLRTRQRA